MRSLTNRLLPYRLLFATLLLLLSVDIAAGQTTAARPDRGVMPNGSYAVSDIENISLQNGNVNLEIPLAALPPIAGGKLSWTIKAHYNSKLWNITRAQADAPDNEYHPYVIDTPQLSDLGGWRISGQYGISIRRAQDDYDYLTDIPPDSLPYNEYQLLINYNWYKVVLTMPDGLEHELRPLDYQPVADGTGLTFLHGYYRESPYATGTMRYYSFDGSYLYATVTTENNWTVILPDGTKVVQTADGIQRLQDTNGNKIKIYSDANGTHYQDEQTGREIRYFYDAAANNGQGQGRVYYKTVGGTEKHIDINFGFTTVQGQVYSVKDWIPYHLNECNRHSEINAQIDVIREIVLPESEPGVTRKFSFSYNSDSTETATNPWVRFTCSDPLQSYTRTASKGWGALKQIQTPSGAVIDYSYKLDSVHLPIFTDNIAEESITQKKLTHDGTFDIWTYSVIQETATVTSPDGGVVEEKKYAHSPGYGFAFGKAGLVYRSTRPFVRIDRHWSDVIFSGASTNSPGGPVSFNPVVGVEYSTLLDAAGNQLKMSAKAFQYDYNGNLLQTTEYDWFDPALVSRDSLGIPTGVPGSATVQRVVANSYYNPATSSTSGNVYAKRFLATSTPLILNALQETTIGPGITRLSYDGQPYGTAPTVGNLTSQSVWDDLDNKWITSSQTYGLYGNPATRTDPRGKVTQLFYDDATHAMPNRVVVDPQNGTGQQTTTTACDYSTGLVTSQTDPNGNTSTVDYTNQLSNSVDPFGRPGVAIGPLVNAGGTNQHHRTTTTYFDGARQVVVGSDLNSENDKLLKTRTTSDMLGRVVLAEQSEDGASYTISARTVYEQMGRITYSSNPARSAGTSTDGWARTTADVLGRIIEVATFGGTAQPPSSGSSGVFTGSVTTSYDANFTTVTDQNAKLRRSMVDGSGRLVRVDEPDAGNNLGSSGSPVQPTSYTYDVLGNLRTVVQGSQTRTFNYDSLSRLRSAINPESGTVSYTYDDNGNLLTKTDARGVVANYVYDALNRNTSVTYTNDPNGTLPVTRVYDQATNGKGRLYQSQTTGAAGSLVTIDSYDPMGRPPSERQQFYANGTWSASYTMQRAYNLAGAVTSQTYPSGRTVAYSYDTAGRSSGFSGNLGDGTQRSYSTEIIYSPLGGMTKEKFGTDTALYNKLFYNSRGQLSEIRESTSYTGPTDTTWNRGAIINHYSNSCWGMCYDLGSNTSQSMSDNNGNLKKQEVYIPSDDQVSSYTTWWQGYDYDNLNRLQRVHEYTGNTSLDWQQEYVYDRYGNRTLHQTNTWGPATGPAINKKDFTVTTANNRLGVPGGQTGTMTYDAAGNLTTDTYSGAAVTRAYDAENRMTSETQANNYLAGSYTYNADGQRARRTVGGQPSAVTTWQVYGFAGELLAEYAASAAPASPQKEYGYRNGQMLITADATATSNGYAYKRSITIDHTKVPNTDQSNFPVLISGTYTYLATTANGGNVQNANGYDVIFTSDSGCSTKLNHEVETYNAGTGAVNYWVKVPTVSPTSDTTIYMCYGNSSITTEQSNKTAVWDSNFKAVYHLPNGSTLSANDSTSNARNGTGTNVSAAAGKSDGGAAMNATTSEIHATSAIVNLDVGTISMWVKSSFNTGSGTTHILFDVDGVRYVLYDAGDSGFIFHLYADGLDAKYSGSLSAGDWHLVHYVYNKTGNVQRLFVDGSEIAQNLSAGAWGASSLGANAHIGNRISVDLGSTSVIDEVRTSSINRSADWIATEYHNQNSPATFYAVSSASGGVASLHWLVTDQLGTPRMIFDQGGSLANVSRHDYLPFGEELVTGQGLRTSAMGYGAADGVRQQFTQKERDIETGLDYFLARYYSSTQGRFTSADPLLSSGTVYDPQSWNRYSYTSNNPLKYTDPFGLYIYDPNATKDQRKKFEQGLKDLAKARDSFKKGSTEYNRLDRALTAYGAVGVNNGVTVMFGTTKTGAPAETEGGIKLDPTNLGNKGVTADNPTGQDTTVRIDPSQIKSADDYVEAIGHEGTHVADREDLVGALPINLTTGAEQVILNGPLNLTKYATEKGAYEVSSIIAQGRGAGSLSIGKAKYEIWNSGWSQADRATKRAAGIDRVLAEPKSKGGSYGVTPANQGAKLIQ